MESPDRPRPPQAPHDDEFLRRLRDLGYLENPLEKFFIGGAHGRTGALVANLKVAAKVGVLGGVFLGLVTALGLGVLSPEIFPDAASAVKLTLYFSAIFTVFFTALELAICLAATLLARTLRRFFTRTEMIALYSGAFAGLVVLAYGTLWWWAAPGRGGLLTARAAAAFAVIATLAAAAGIMTRLAVSALLAVLGGAELAARGKGRATKIYFAALVAGVLFFGGYHLATARSAPEGPSPYEVSAAGLPVTLIAIDGASLEYFDYLRQQGLLPNLAALAADGAVAPLAPAALAVNPSVWTTVSCGVEPSRHGVTSYSAQEIPGLSFYIRDRVGMGLYDALLATLPAVGLSKRAPLERRGMAYPALWDVAAQKGVLSGVVNWWGTWPAADFHGFVVTDRMYPKLQVAAAAGTAASYEREAHPERLFNSLSAERAGAAGPKISADAFAAAAAIDTFARAALEEGRRGYPEARLTAVYLPGLDIYENALYAGLEDGWEMAGAARAADGVARYWRFLDEQAGKIIAAREAGGVVIVVGDPGMPKALERRLGGRKARGFVIVSGGPARAARLEEPLNLVDIAPAALYLLGFPVSAEMDGRVPAELFDAAHMEQNPVREVETFGRVRVTPPGEYSVGAQQVEWLRSLGYLQ